MKQTDITFFDFKLTRIFFVFNRYWKLGFVRFALVFVIFCIVDSEMTEKKYFILFIIDITDDDDNMVFH